MARPLVVGTRPRHAFVLLVLLLAVATIPSATAQEIFAVQIQADSTEGTSSGGCVVFQPTVRNTGSSPLPQQHQIDLTFGAPPAGWRLEVPATTQLMLPPNTERTVNVALCPTENADAEQGATVSMTATVTSDPRNPPAAATQTFTAYLQEEGLFGFDLPDAALYIALAAILGLLGVVLLTRKRPSAGIAVSCPEPAKEVLPDRGTSFPVRIRNEGRERDVVTLTTSPVPRGWDTFLPLVDIPLEPREEQTVWLSVKSPADARSGDRVVVKVIARSATGGGEPAEIDTLTTVREPEGRASNDPPWGGEPSPAPDLPEDEVPVETAADEERSVYGREDDGTDRPVAVKRRKA